MVTKYDHIEYKVSPLKHIRQVCELWPCSHSCNTWFRNSGPRPGLEKQQPRCWWGEKWSTVLMWIKIQQMQQYADIYLLQSYSTCFGCQSTHHQEYRKLYPQPPVQVILLVPLLPSNMVWSGLVCVSRLDSHKPVLIRPRWRGVAVQVVWPVQTSPDQTTLEGSSGTSRMTCTNQSWSDHVGGE